MLHLDFKYFEYHREKKNNYKFKLCMIYMIPRQNS